MPKEKLTPAEEWAKSYMDSALDLVKESKGKRPVTLCISHMFNGKSGNVGTTVSLDGFGSSPEILMMATTALTWIAVNMEKEHGIPAEATIDAFGPAAKIELEELKRKSKNNV